jgi:hypothetical protein
MAQTLTIPIDDHSTACTMYYLVQYKFNGDVGYFFTDKFYDSPIVLQNMQDSAVYDIRITRYCCNGSTADPVDITTSTTPVPEPSTLGASQVGVDVELAWTDMSVDSYEIQRATNVGFTTGLTDIYSGVWVATVTDLAVPAGSYWYRVRSIDGGVASIWIVDPITVV